MTATTGTTGTSTALARPAGAPPRLPVPTRDRRPALAALAVLLILGGGLVSGLLVFRSGERADYLVVRAEVLPGHRITAADLGIARIAGTGAKAIPQAEHDAVVGSYATVRLFPGTLLTRDMLEPEPSVPSGSAVVGVSLDPSQAPADGVRAGDVVMVLLVPDRGSGENPSQLVAAARVVGGGSTGADAGTGLVGSPGSTGISLSLLVPANRAAAIATASAQGRAAVVLLPPDTAPSIG